MLLWNLLPNYISHCWVAYKCIAISASGNKQRVKGAKVSYLSLRLYVMSLRLSCLGSFFSSFCFVALCININVWIHRPVQGFFNRCYIDKDEVKRNKLTSTPIKVTIHYNLLVQDISDWLRLDALACGWRCHLPCPLPAAGSYRLCHYLERLFHATI